MSAIRTGATRPCPRNHSHRRPTSHPSKKDDKVTQDYKCHGSTRYEIPLRDNFYLTGLLQNDYVVPFVVVSGVIVTLMFV